VYRRQSISRRKGERGVVILLVAIVLLFVVGAMAALAVDFVTFYTARSEAQLAADSAALAGARMMANSGVTSNPSDSGLNSAAQTLAENVARQVAMSNKVGGRNLVGTEVVVTLSTASSGGGGGLGPNPRITVQISRTDLPTFFARIWGRTQLSLSASATAEAYNPSGLNGSPGRYPTVAPICVKPWVLPNLDPNGNPLFNATTGAAINASGVLGWSDAAQPTGRFRSATGGAPQAWHYYPGSQLDFPAPTQALPNCGGLDSYQESIAGCVSTPISCNSTVRLDTGPYFQRTRKTAIAVNCLTHAATNGGDQVSTAPPGRAFRFVGGDGNPIAALDNQEVMVSNSLVTVPVYNSSGVAPGTTVQIVGFVQLFMNPDGNAAPTAGFGGPPPPIKTAVVNLVGCGTNASTTDQPVLGNGASPVAVRLVTP